jgi:hypothetical protein
MPNLTETFNQLKRSSEIQVSVSLFRVIFLQSEICQG